CADDSFTNARTTMLANGTIFATICTPDITTNFLSDLSLEYQSQGLSKEEADKKASDNLVIASLPKLPVSYDITTTVDVTDSTQWIAQKTMGGINGYGISSYSKHKEWALKFVEFATSKQMVAKRAEMLGIVPARGDVIEQISNTATAITFENLDNGTLVVMPSISSVKQIWIPISSGLKQIATDGCGDRKLTLDDLQTILETIDDNIYKAIHTFSE
ncbi:MAG: extracellular solute-binding protein, partial [Clostridia bacterium]|nr:extracellular solute-binding protein [Clostridia bacterium]